jgi:DNA-binding transcriptional LysR family regulator
VSQNEEREMFDLEDLQTFVEVADAGGLTPAARRLGLSKSIVSRRLVRLEEDLGVQLLSRTTRGAALTEAGATFREHASRVVTELVAARDALTPEGDLRGRLRVAAPLTFGPTHVAPVLAELARRHPQLQLHASYADRFVDLIGEGFDAAIRVGYLTDSNLIVRRVAPMRGKFVASAEYVRTHGAPKTPEELVDHQALMQGTETWRVVCKGKTAHVGVHGRFKADNGEALLAAALAGLGIAGLPDFMVDQHLATGALVPVLADYPPPEGGIYVVRPPGDFPARKVRALIEIMVERFA